MYKASILLVPRLLVPNPISNTIAFVAMKVTESPDKDTKYLRITEVLEEVDMK